MRFSFYMLIIDALHYENRLVAAHHQIGKAEKQPFPNSTHQTVELKEK